MLLLIILLLLPLVSTQQSVYMASSCAFLYHKVGTSWVFDKCTEPQNTGMKFSSDWRVCWILCCGDWSSDRAWSSPSIFSECQSARTASSNNKTIMIVGIVIGGTFIFLVLGYVIYKLTSGNERSRVNPQHKLAIMRMNIVRSLVWKSDLGRINQSLESHQDLAWRSEECAICLDQGSNTLLHCQHSFHYRCFLEWMKKSKDCPLCRIPCINKVKVRCNKCNQKHVEIQFQKLMFALDELLIEGSMCHQCKHQEQAQKLFDDSLGTITHNSFVR